MRLWSTGEASNVLAPAMGRLTRTPISTDPDRSNWIAFGNSADLQTFGDDWSGYAGVLSLDSARPIRPIPLPAVYSPPHLDYLDTGDVVQLLPSGVVRVLYRRRSEHNTILATECCNSLCLMCSQPPRAVDDSYRIGEILRLLELIDPLTRELGLSGGEPTLLGNGFLAIVDKAAKCLPNTALHVLTNGRLFKNELLARRLSEIQHHDLMLGIPLYSDVDWRHDYVVQARGAYDETLAGLYNLARLGVRIEIRVVLHRQTVERLPNLAEFIARNLPFVEHVALMGLEMFGFTPRNLDSLWIDPVDYSVELEAATRVLARSGLHVSIYNHQLCTIPRSVWPFAVKSISDWKNVYLDECRACGVRHLCGGLFQSATKKHSAYVHALEPLSDSAAKWFNRWWGIPEIAAFLQDAGETANIDGWVASSSLPSTSRILPIVSAPS